MENESSIRHLPYTVNESTDRNHHYENHWKRVALNLLVKHTGKLDGITMLNFGCGRRKAMQYAKDAGMFPTGLDTDPTWLALATQSGEIQEIDLQSAAEHVGIHSFDAVACFHMLAHVDNPRATLSMLRSPARKQVLTAVPNPQKVSILRKPWATQPEPKGGQLQSWNRSHFRNLAKKHCGLRLLSWGFDATQLPIISASVNRMFGQRMEIHFATGALRRAFPYYGISIIGLWGPV